MANLQLRYGNNILLEQIKKRQQVLTCPNCSSLEGQTIRIRRKWWQKLFFAQRRYYRCLECKHRFWLTPH